MKPSKCFVVATPDRSVCDNQARVLSQSRRLRRYLLGQIQGHPDIPGEETRMFPPYVIWSKIALRLAGPGCWEWLRSAGYPAFDYWACSQLKPGDNVISSYGYANRCFRYARSTGGLTFLDAGNSHPAQFWEIIEAEHKKWGIDRKPMPRHWNERARKMLEDTDYIFSPSSYVTDSFLRRGWSANRIFYLPYPVDLEVFRPRVENRGSRVEGRPLRVICTGSVSVRKGFPYLLEAMRIIRGERDAVLMLTDVVESSMKEILLKFSDVPIEWSPALPHELLAERLRSADVFALLSLEDGFARTVTEALACGLPAVVSRHTGALDFIRPGLNGEIVPMCDAPAAADAILRCANMSADGATPNCRSNLEELSFARFSERFLAILDRF